MKNAFILLQFIILPAFVSGQSYVYLNEYTSCSCQLDSIIKYVQNYVKVTDIISVSAKVISDKEYNIYVSAFSLSSLRYGYCKTILGYINKNNTIIFKSSAKELVCRKTKNNHRIRLSCNPPPTKERPLSVVCTDGSKEWTFSIKGDTITLIREVLAW